MSAVGPEMPPHLLAKRKRKQQETADNETSTPSGAEPSRSPGNGEKRRRVIGPAMPPAPLDERPVEPPSVSREADSDSDDGYGPSLPSFNKDENFTQAPNGHNNSDMKSVAAPVTEKLQRDEWMTMPPKEDDLAARMDPTKQRPRAFNTGKGPKGANTPAGDSSAWHETIEEKQKRLADEMMGVSTTGPEKPNSNARPMKEEVSNRKIKDYADKNRGPSLVEQHQGQHGKDMDDDPSKRSFDREKDMASGMKVGQAQRKELLNNACNFSSKFSSGSYL